MFFVCRVLWLPRCKIPGPTLHKLFGTVRFPKKDTIVRAVHEPHTSLNAGHYKPVKP